MGKFDCPALSYDLLSFFLASKYTEFKNAMQVILIDWKTMINYNCLFHIYSREFTLGQASGLIMRAKFPLKIKELRKISHEGFFMKINLQLTLKKDCEIVNLREVTTLHPFIACNKSSTMEPTELKLADIIKKYLDFLKKKQGLKKQDIANAFNIKPSVLSTTFNPKSGSNRGLFSFDKGKGQFSRQDLVDELEKKYGLSWDGLQVQEKSSAPFVVEEEQKSVYIEYFIYNHLEYNPNDQPTFVKSLLQIKKSKQEKLAELKMFRRGNIITYQGKVLEEPEQLVIRFRNEDKKEGTEGAVVFIKKNEGDLSDQVLYGTYQASGLSCGLVVLEKMESEISIETLQAHPTPLEILLDLLNQPIHSENQYQPLSHINHHPQHNLSNNIRDHFGVYEGVTLVPDFTEELNPFVFEINHDFTVRYSSRTANTVVGMAKPYKDSIFYVHLRYSKELQAYLNEIIIKFKNIRGSDSMAGIMAGINDDNAPLCGIAMFKKSKHSFEQLSQEIGRKTFADIQNKFPNLIDFFAGSKLFSNFVASDTPKAIIRFFNAQQIDLSSALGLPALSHVSLSYRHLPEHAIRWAGVYNLYRLSTDGTEIIINWVKLNADGKVELKGYRHNNFFTGYWFLIDDHLTLVLDKKNKSLPFLFVLTYRVGNSSRREHKWFHGLSLSQTTLSEIRSGLEVMVVSNEDFEKGKTRSIQIPINGKHSEAYEQLNRTHQGLATFLTGQKQNILHQTRRPEDSFTHEDSLKTTYYNSACMFAIKAQAAAEQSEAQAAYFELCQKELLAAIEHGFGQAEEDLTDLIREKSNGYFHKIPPKYWDEVQSKIFWPK